MARAWGRYQFYGELKNRRITSIMNSVYPVNSFYFTTASTCPLQALGIGTWQKVGSSIITSVNTEVPIKGNGMTLGLTNGSRKFGFRGDYGSSRNSQLFQDSSYGVDVSATGGSATDAGYSGKIGVTEDSANSGIVGTVTRTSLTVNIFKRTA